MVVKHRVRGVVVALLVLLVVLLASGAAFAQETDSAGGETTAGSVTPSETSEEDSGSGGGEVLSGLAMCASPLGSGTSELTSWLSDAVGVDLPSCKDGVTGAFDAGVTRAENEIEDMAAGAVEKTALWIGNAGVAVLKFALGWWITGTEMDRGTFQDTVATVNDYTFYLQVAALSLSLILLGGRLALARSGAIRDTSEEGLKQLARAAVLAGGATTMIVLGTRVSDRISAWFLGSAVGSDPSRLAEAMVTIYLYSGPAGVGVLFLIGLIGMLGGLMMAFLMLLRTGILVLMAAALPIAGAAGGTKVGSQAFEKMLAWTIAFLLVKPVGAFVIGVSAILFLEATPTITDPGNGDGFMALSGVITLCAAALVLPALMRLIVPNVGALGGGGSGAAAAMGAAAVGAKVGGMITTGGASGAASGAATSTSTSTSMGTPPSGAQTGGAPPGFGAAGGGPAGNQQGTPSAGGAGASAQGNSSGTPGGGGNGQPGGNTSGAPGGRSSGETAAAAAVASGAGQQFHRGGFEQ